MKNIPRTAPVNADRLELLGARPSAHNIAAFFAPVVTLEDIEKAVKARQLFLDEDGTADRAAWTRFLVANYTVEGKAAGVQSVAAYRAYRAGVSW